MHAKREVNLNSKLDARVPARRFQEYFYQYCIMVISIPVKCLYPVNSDIDRETERKSSLVADDAVEKWNWFAGKERHPLF